MRTREEAVELYFSIRRKYPTWKKRTLNRFEAQKFFRFGNSWRRLAYDKKMVIVLNDDSEKLEIIKGE